MMFLHPVGPISEVLFPIDNLTKRPKGFAFVTYMMPENAVTALAQLDGHVFQVFDLLADVWIIAVMSAMCKTIHLEEQLDISIF